MRMVAVFKPYLIYLSEIGYPLVTFFARYLLINVKGLGVSGARFYEKITFSQHKLLFCLFRQTHFSRCNLPACLSHRKHFCPSTSRLPFIYRCSTIHTCIIFMFMWFLYPQLLAFTDT